MPVPPDTRILYKSAIGHAKAMATYERLCARITVPYTTQWVDTPFGWTHSLVAGLEGKPPLVLLHGQGASAPTWNGQINILAAHYRITVLDVPASTGKSTPTRLPRAGTAAGKWLDIALTDLGVSAAHMVGISNGAWLILKLASIAPEKIKSASLLSAAGLVPTSTKLMLQAIPFLAMGAVLSPERKARIFGRLMGVPNTPTPNDDLEMFTILLGYFKMEPTPGPLPVAELKRLIAPTQLLIGAHEAAFPAPAVIERAKATLPNLKHAEVLPNVGHGMITEDVTLVSGRIHQFVQSIEQAPSG